MCIEGVGIILASTVAHRSTCPEVHQAWASLGKVDAARQAILSDQSFVTIVRAFFAKPEINKSLSVFNTMVQKTKKIFCLGPSSPVFLLAARAPLGGRGAAEPLC